MSQNAALWLRGGAAPEPSLPPQLWLAISGGVDALLGGMVRVAGGWRLNTPAPSFGQNFVVRARGAVAAGEFGGSQGAIDSVRRRFISERIFANTIE